MAALRRIILLACISLLVGETHAAPPSGPLPLPRPRPALKSDKASKPEKAPTSATATKVIGIGAAKAQADKVSAAKTSAKTIAAKTNTPKTNAAKTTLAAPAAVGAALLAARAPAALQPGRRAAPTLAMATSSATSPLDLGAVKQALDLVRKGEPDEATSSAAAIADPLARKVVEWVILRSDDNSIDFARYAAFIAANPSWPSIVTLRRRAEVALWQQNSDPQTVIKFFHAELPHSAKGWFALARALLATGDPTRASDAVRAAWRDNSFSADLETQARQAFAGLITPAEDKMRMDMRLYDEDDDAALRAAHHLDNTQLAIAKARAAVVNKAGNAKALLEAVPAAARHDAGYVFSRIQWLRRADRIKEAGEAIAAAPRDPAVLGDLDQWWVERRLIARKLIDLGDFKLAYEVANQAAAPSSENYRADQQFTAGWIALRFLHQAAPALAHFARIAEGVANPITLARSFYWQGRAAETLGHSQDAHAHYQAAARFPTAYYGQLARSRLGLNEVSLSAPPDPPVDLRALEVARAFEILYAIDARDLVATMAADIADKAADVAALTTLAEIAARHNDARVTLLIGKTALGHGLPLEHYAFPTFGVPSYQQVGPAVDPWVVYAIVRQESAFNPRVVSSANAMGLMQVTPAAGRTIAKRLNMSFDQHRLLDDAVYNAQLGTAELGDVINSYRGSYILVFASYNAGRGRVKEWIEQHGDPRDRKVDPVDWIERIPFSETRNYVQRVMENMQVYRARIDKDSKLSIESDLRGGG